jgi:hypothetical protein
MIAAARVSARPVFGAEVLDAIVVAVARLSGLAGIAGAAAVERRLSRGRIQDAIFAPFVDAPAGRGTGIGGVSTVFVS